MVGSQLSDYKPRRRNTAGTHTHKEKNNRDLQGKIQAMQRGPEEEKRVNVRKEIINNWKEAFQTQERLTSIKRLTEYERKIKERGRIQISSIR